ncbi:MAG: MoaD/ThiS family protein [Thermoleophilia bacterium]|nr:MoaD/ThiS family protein [Thermoleophilia bacterium]
MQLTIKLGSTLRRVRPDWAGGEGFLELPSEGRVIIDDVILALDLAPEDVNLIYRNHRLVSATAKVQDGDRVALFPPNFIHFSQFYLKRGAD